MLAKNKEAQPLTTGRPGTIFEPLDHRVSVSSSRSVFRTMKPPRANGCKHASRRAVGVLLILSVGVTAALVAGQTAAAAGQQKADLKPDAGPVSYFKDIRPIVREHCAGCHQPAVKQGELTLT